MTTPPPLARARRSLALAALALAGCGELSPPVHSAAVRADVTRADPALATVDYWWNQPPTARAEAVDYRTLWDACEAECRARFFRVDRQEYRSGLLTTVPLISKQIFEPWRTDAVTYPAEWESTLATIRRTLRFEIHKGGAGYEVVPKALVERYAVVERRLTAISQYHSAFSGARAFTDSPDLSGFGQTADAATEYWYPLHRDAALERDLATRISQRLQRRTASPGPPASAGG